MAYQRISDGTIQGATKRTSLDAFVQSLAQSFKNQMAVRNAEDELKFNEAVNSGDLSLEDQIQYRKEQLTRVSDDPEERRRVRGEIASLKKRKEEADFTDGYSGKLADFQAGISSIDNVIQFLKDSRDNTNNQDIISTIEGKIADAQQKKFELTQQIVKNNTEYATNSKSIPVIDTQIGKVQGYRAAALLSGNDQLVSVYDLQLQGLNAAKNAAKVTNDVLSLGAVSATGAFSAVSMLDALNNKIGTATSTGPVKIGETTYANEKDFWTAKRDSYLSDSTSNGFFPSLSSEVKDKISVANSKNALTTSALTNFISIYDTLGSRPELANYSKQLAIYKQDSLQHGANSIAQTVVNDFSRTLDVGNAVAQLNTLKALGVNVDKAYTDVITNNAATKNAQVQGILEAAKTAMQNDPSLTPEKAVAQAVAAGAGTVISPNDAAGKTEGKIATEAVQTANQNKGTNDTRTTVPSVAPTEPVNTPQPSGNVSTATILGLPNLTPGMNSPDVKTLQQYLIEQGYAIPSGATGLYGAETTAAVKALQEKLGVDNSTGIGYFGPRTKEALNTNQPPTVVTPAPAPTPTVNAPVQTPPAPSPIPSANAPTPQLPAAPAPKTPKAVSFSKVGNGVDIKYDDGTFGRSSVEYARTLGYTGN